MRPSIQRTGLYGAGFLCLILAILKLTVETHWSWSRVLLPVWTVLGYNLLYIGVGFIWLSFAMFADNVLRRIEKAGQMEGFGLTSARWELIIVLGVLSVSLQVLFWSEVMPPVRH